MWSDISKSAFSWSNALIVNASHIEKSPNFGMIFLPRLILSVTILIACRLTEANAISLNKFEIGYDNELRVEKILAKFMVDLKKITVTKCSYRYVVVVAKERKDFQAAVGFSTGSSCVTATPAVLIRKFATPRSFCAITFFTDGVDESELNSTLAKIPKMYTSNVWLISTSQNDNYETIAARLQLARNMKIRNVKVAHLDRSGVMKIYRINLLPDCSHKMKLVNSWTSENGFITNTAIFDSYRLSPDLFGCHRRISSTSFGRDPLKSLRKFLIETIADDLHFVPVMLEQPMRKEFVSVPDKTPRNFVVADVISGRADFGIGMIRPTLENVRYLDFTEAYTNEYLVWTVPVTKPIRYEIFSAFTPLIWVFIILPLFLYSSLASVISKWKTGKYHVVRSICDVISITLNYAIVYYPAGITKTSLFIIYLMYARIIATTYSTWLASTLASASPFSEIESEMEIVASGFRVGGSDLNRVTFIDQTDVNSTSYALINRYEIIPSTDEALKRIDSGEKLALLERLSEVNRATIKRLMNNESAMYYPISNDRVRLYGASICLDKGSSITERLDILLSRLTESGIIRFFEQKHAILRSLITRKIIQATREQSATISPIFFNYITNLVAACLSFIGELIFSRFRIGYPRNYPGNRG
ncbi:uncharacterized protein LOC125500969 [Athalia rosae]|uniref:uncharacterized protein LOC125500969 n=1 Tax=Athalia rosae TaxID=37344 RepID=UPI0020340218|nr:uncharacterized protein LOC125500969 [Athalia rosae]